MADQFGSTIRSGQVTLPALFQGTARLLERTEAPPAPKPARHDDLEGQFQADLPLTFALLHSVGFEPVPPSHPAYPAYLEASRQHASAPNEPPSAPPSPHGHDTIVMPFETTITITEEMALQFGLVAPGHGASRSNHQAQPAARKRKAAVPPPYFNAKTEANSGLAPSSGGDLRTFLQLIAGRTGSSSTARTAAPSSLHGNARLQAELGRIADDKSLSNIMGSASGLQFAVDRHIITTTNDIHRRGRRFTKNEGPDTSIIPVGLEQAAPLVSKALPMIMQAIAALLASKMVLEALHLLAAKREEIQNQIASAAGKTRKILQTELEAIDTALDDVAHQVVEVYHNTQNRLQSATREDKKNLEAQLQTMAEAVQALEYRGQLKHNTLNLLSQVRPELKQGLNEDPEQSRLEIHHTVPYRSAQAEKARGILRKWGLSLHDPADAAILPNSYHRSEMVHGMPESGYDKVIVSALESADENAVEAAQSHGRTAGRKVILEKLRQLSDWVVDSSHDPRAIELEHILRFIERPLPRPDLSNEFEWKGYDP